MKNRKPMLSPEAVAFVAGEQQTAAPSPAPPSEQKEKLVRFTVDLPKPLQRRLKTAAMDREQHMTDAAREAITQWLDGLGY